MKRAATTVTTVIFSFALAACGNDAPPASTSVAAPAAPPVAVAPKASSPQLQLAADMELSSKVKEIVPESEREHVEVSASDGVVTLYGTVGQSSDKDRIALLAMDVQGVRSVVNNLVAVRGS